LSDNLLTSQDKDKDSEEENDRDNNDTAIIDEIEAEDEDITADEDYVVIDVDIRDIDEVKVSCIMKIQIIPFGASHGSSFITLGQLKDANGTPQTVFNEYETMQAYFEYVIPDGVVINAGDTMTVAIPPQLRLSGTVTFNLYDSNGAIVGVGVANAATNIITITFTDYYETHIIGRQGNFFVWVAWELSQITIDDPFIIQFPVNTISVAVTPGNPIDSDEVLFKWGWVDDNRQIIHWVARVNFAMDNIHNAVFRDTLGQNHVLINNDPQWPAHNVYIQIGYWVNNAQGIPSFVQLGHFHPGDYGRLTVAPNGTSFEINLGNLVRYASTAMPGAMPGSPVHQYGVSAIIHYTTRVTDNGDAAETIGYANEATLEGSNHAPATVAVRTPILGGGGTGGGTSTDRLLLQKLVAGEGADLSKSFTFTVTFSNPVTYNDNPFTSGTIMLAHGETALFTSIPPGTTYTIVEADYSGEGYVSNHPDNTVTGTVTDEEEITVTFTNTYSTKPPTHPPTNPPINSPPTNPPTTNPPASHSPTNPSTRPPTDPSANAPTPHR